MKTLTLDGSKAIFICERTNGAVWDLNRPYACVIEGYGEIWNYFPNGRLYIGENFETENDIISEWDEPINEEELDNLAELFTPVELITHYNLSISKEQVDIIKDCFKAGFKLAKK